MGRKRFEVCPKCGRKGYGSSDSLYLVGRQVLAGDGIVRRCIYCRYTNLTKKELFNQFNAQIDDLSRALDVAKSLKEGHIYKVVTSFNREVSLIVDMLDYPGFSGRMLTSEDYIMSKGNEDFWVSYSDVTKLEEIPLKNLPLFVGAKYKSKLYERFIKGETVK